MRIGFKKFFDTIRRNLWAVGSMMYHMHPYSPMTWVSTFSRHSSGYDALLLITFTQSIDIHFFMGFMGYSGLPVDRAYCEEAITSSKELLCDSKGE